MRVLAIGLGGAGCRIVNGLYAADHRSSKVACVQALAIDVDEAVIAQLADLPEKSKLCFPALEPDVSGIPGAETRSGTVDIDEVIARIQNFEISETDAIFIFCGLGGSMTNAAQQIITALKSSVIEPIFGLVTLPCLSEGEKRSAKAADDIEMLAPLLDGVILFDNETWSKKITGLERLPQQKDTGLAELFGLKKSRQSQSPEDSRYALLNNGIIRRISLILKAGEFKADGGIDLAEVVVDSGEVLNTMKGMGFITIGYAVEHLQHQGFDFLSKWRPASYFAEESKKRDSRIVELAKQAIYNEVSTPCDMTSAAKALILIAGPSHELSMKGFMTVRKWIDRSIAGLETRSGDYPITNTRYVAIIIMLAGLENIPRITELKEIREQYHAGLLRGERRGQMPGQVDEMTSGSDESFRGSASALSGRSVKKDEMIVLPGKRTGSEPQRGIPARERPQSHITAEPVKIPDFKKKETDQEPSPAIIKTYEESQETKPVPAQDMTEAREAPQVVIPKEEPPKSRVIDVTALHAKHRIPVSRTPHSHPAGVSSGKVTGKPSAPVIPETFQGDESMSSQVKEDLMKTKEQERQRIERELQRQRILSISGKQPQKKEVPAQSQKSHVHLSPETRTIIRRSSQSRANAAISQADERKVVIRQKRSLPHTDEPDLKKESQDPAIIQETDRVVEDVSLQREYPDSRASAEPMIEMIDTIKRSKDSSLTGKQIAIATQPRVNDDALLRPRIKPKKEQNIQVDAVNPGTQKKPSGNKKEMEPEGEDEEDQSSN